MRLFGSRPFLIENNHCKLANQIKATAKFKLGHKGLEQASTQLKAASFFLAGFLAAALQEIDAHLLAVYPAQLAASVSKSC